MQEARGLSWLDISCEELRWWLTSTTDKTVPEVRNRDAFQTATCVTSEAQSASKYVTSCGNYPQSELRESRHHTLVVRRRTRAHNATICGKENNDKVEQNTYIHQQVFTTIGTALIIHGKDLPSHRGENKNGPSASIRLVHTRTGKPIKAKIAAIPRCSWRSQTWTEFSGASCGPAAQVSRAPTESAGVHRVG